MTTLKQQALDYHEFPKPGKISVESSKPCATAQDLSLAYTPGVAAPVREIAQNPENAYRYTNKGNLGPLASKPVMEGKGILFKRFAGIDVFDIEVNAPSIESFIETVVNISPTFGGINLEDIAAPHCFEIEKALKARLDIPVFHDDQHGTAVIICAGLLNALEIQGKRLEDAKLVCLGAGAAGLAGMRLLISMGAKKENMTLVDSKGVIHAGRTDLNVYKQEFAKDTPMRTLTDAMAGADVFIGVSGPNLVTREMVKIMAAKPVVFAMANPDPEILPQEAHAARDDLIMATGRSDFPNQVNNVLGFPFIFRGALDARAKSITEKMLVAAVRALAELAREPVPEEVLKAYNAREMSFGKEYILPKPFDPRLIDRIPQAVAKAAE
jgi:malate dehydrogenase (oxaloacetate-decarboxylating)(NADP+)